MIGSLGSLNSDCRSFSQLFENRDRPKENKVLQDDD